MYSGAPAKVVFPLDNSPTGETNRFDKADYYATFASM